MFNILKSFTEFILSDSVPVIIAVLLCALIIKYWNCRIPKQLMFLSAEILLLFVFHVSMGIAVFIVLFTASILVAYTMVSDKVEDENEREQRMEGKKK